MSFKSKGGGGFKSHGAKAGGRTTKNKAQGETKPRPSFREVSAKLALKAVKKAERTAAKAGVAFSPWEDAFLTDVEARLKTYGRAFADPDKGAPGAALSVLQTYKLKEITAKARKSTNGAPQGRKGFRSRRPAEVADPDEES